MSIFFSRWGEDGRDRAVKICVVPDVYNRGRQAHARQSLVIWLMESIQYSHRQSSNGEITLTSISADSAATLIRPSDK